MSPFRIPSHLCEACLSRIGPIRPIPRHAEVPVKHRAHGEVVLGAAAPSLGVLSSALPYWFLGWLGVLDAVRSLGIGEICCSLTIKELRPKEFLFS